MKKTAGKFRNRNTGKIMVGIIISLGVYLLVVMLAALLLRSEKIKINAAEILCIAGCVMGVLLGTVCTAGKGNVNQILGIALGLAASIYTIEHFLLQRTMGIDKQYVVGIMMTAGVLCLAGKLKRGKKRLSKKKSSNIAQKLYIGK